MKHLCKIGMTYHANCENGVIKITRLTRYRDETIY